MSRKIEQIFDVSKKTVLITGASGYLGEEMAKVFAANGSTLILLGRSQKISALVDELQSTTTGKVHFFQVDFYDRAALENVVKKIKAEFNVDVLVNNAYDMGPNTGFNVPVGRVENIDFDTWQRAFESGIYWAFYLAQQIGESMKKRGGGSIINVSSMYGVVAPDSALYEGTDFFNPVPYSVVKTGILGLTRYLASFWAKHGIRCNAVSPGPFSNTKSKSDNAVSAEDPFLEKVKNKTLLKRVGKPEELSGALLLLASDAGSYITGQNIMVDGGWSVT